MTTQQKKLTANEITDCRTGNSIGILKRLMDELPHSHAKNRALKDMLVPRATRNAPKISEKDTFSVATINICGQNFLLPTRGQYYYINGKSLRNLDSSDLQDCIRNTFGCQSWDRRDKITKKIKIKPEVWDIYLAKTVPKIRKYLLDRRAKSLFFRERRDELETMSKKEIFYKIIDKKGREVCVVSQAPTNQKKYTVKRLEVSQKVAEKYKQKKVIESSIDRAIRVRRRNLKEKKEILTSDFFKKYLNKEAFLCYPKNLGQSITVEMEVCDYSLKKDERSVAGLRSTNDCSLRGARTREFILPLLDKTYKSRLEKYLSIFSDVKVNSSCGLHVHLDMRQKSEAEARAIYWNLYQSSEIFKQVVPTSRLRNKYCKFNKYNAPSHSRPDGLNGECVNSRYCAINFNAYSKHGTIEVRAFAGSCDAQKIGKNIELTLFLQNNPCKTISIFANTAPISLVHWFIERMTSLEKSESKINQAKKILKKRLLT